MKINIKNIPFLILISFVLIIFSSCNQTKVKSLSIDMIYGDWIGEFNSDVQVIITPDSLFWGIRDRYTIAQNYQYKISEDSILLFSEDGMIIKLLLMPEKDMLICCSYKTYIDSFRIDEVMALQKIKDENKLDEIQLQNIKLHKDIIIVPENQIGIFLIAFSQKDGNEVVLDEAGNRVFTFESGSNILYSQGKEDIKKLALNQFEVFQKSESGKLKPYPVLHKLDLNGDLQETELMAIIEGFNQGGRKNLNKLVDKDISGNVLWFNIGTEATTSNTYDSIFYNN